MWFKEAWKKSRFEHDTFKILGNCSSCFINCNDHFHLKGWYLHETRTNSDQYETFEAGYMKPVRNAWYLVLVQNDVFCLRNISLTHKHTCLKFLDPVWDLMSFTRDQNKPWLVQEFLISVQQPRLNWTGLSSLSGWFHAKKRMYEGIYEPMPVWVHRILM